MPMMDNLRLSSVAVLFRPGWPACRSRDAGGRFFQGAGPRAWWLRPWWLPGHQGPATCPAASAPQKKSSRRQIPRGRNLAGARFCLGSPPAWPVALDALDGQAALDPGPKGTVGKVLRMGVVNPQKSQHSIFQNCEIPRGEI